MEAWKAYNSTDGPGGQHNLLGRLTFPAQQETRPTRANTKGTVTLPLKFRADSFVIHAHDVWNASEGLRAAKTTFAAKKVSKNLANKAPT